MSKNTSLTELYLVRHAETVMNTSPHLVGGRSNESPVTPLGVEQARRLGRAMLAKGIMPDKVFASPAVRTLDTARYSMEEMGLDVEPIVQDAIQELGQGVAEGGLREQVYTAPVLQDIARVGKDFRHDGGESMNDVGLRMSGWISESFPTGSHAGRERYFVYTHGGAIKYLASHILGWSHEQTYGTEIDNTSVNLFTIENGVCSVQYLNRDAERI